VGVLPGSDSESVSGSENVSDSERECEPFNGPAFERAEARGDTAFFERQWGRHRYHLERHCFATIFEFPNYERWERERLQAQAADATQRCWSRQPRPPTSRQSPTGAVDGEDGMG
jgi:hypothetical protein